MCTDYGNAVLFDIATSLQRRLQSALNTAARLMCHDGISREQFTRDLKTFLFAWAYSSEAPLRTSV